MSNTPDAAELAARLRAACKTMRYKRYTLADLIPLMQQAADALAAPGAEAAAPAAQSEVPAKPFPSETPAGWPEAWRRDGFNCALPTAAEALRFLANNERPYEGEARFNAAHLLQTANELEITQRVLLAAAPTAPAGCLTDTVVPPMLTPEQIDAILEKVPGGPQWVTPHELSRAIEAAVRAACGVKS